MEQFELIVIGTGPAGEKAAVKAAYFGHKVAIIEKETTFGGAEVVTGTLPSKTLKETALYFSGKYEKGLFGIDRDLKREASIEDFMYRKNYVTTSAALEIRENLIRHQVTIFQGAASFEDPHTIRIQGTPDTLIRGENILIATGSYPNQPSSIPFDGKRILDSDTILQLTRFPSSLCIVGAGVIGCEYATIFATIGTKVYLINNKEHILPFVDHEISASLVEQMQAAGVEILFNHSVAALIPPKSDQNKIIVELKSKEKIEVDMFLFAAGRNGNTKQLNCEKIGLKLDAREQVLVDAQYKTNIPQIYAVGDCIGFPALASTSMEQGRVAVAHMFQTQDLKSLSTYLPYGIYTVPEVSMIGITEDAAIEKKIPYLVGRARYADLARGKILGSKSGFLKLVFGKEDLKILGVHIIGHIATELIHYGMLLVEEGKTLNDVIQQVFNYPTLHDLYKYAAYDGLSIHVGKKIKP